MILPLWGQTCTVEYRGEQVIGHAHTAYIDHHGRYRIPVHSGRWGYAIDFKASDLRLHAVVYADGEVYNAEEAFLNKYSSAQQRAMLEAESSVAPAKPTPPPSRVTPESQRPNPVPMPNPARGAPAPIIAPAVAAMVKRMRRGTRA